jgi:hypothetical protein
MFVKAGGISFRAAKRHIQPAVKFCVKLISFNYKKFIVIR